jgi:predicted Zn finger-like uncharacterized protein
MFKVVSDQLKLRKGMVRCGTCQRVFNGLESLRPVTTPTIVQSAPLPSGLQAALFKEIPAAAPTSPTDTDLDLNTAFFLPEYELDDGTNPAPAHPDVHTLPMFNEAGAVVLQPVRVAPPAPSEEVDAVDFFAGGASEQPTLVRSFKRFTPWVVTVLLLLAVVQALVVGRDWISAYFPDARPVLADTLQPLGLAVRAPRHLDVLSLTSTEIRATEQADQFQLVAVLVNRGGHTVAWPGFDLVLNNAQGEAIVKRVLSPQEFLPPELQSADALTQGMRANSEREIRLRFSVPNVKFSDYALSLFYP